LPKRAAFTFCNQMVFQGDHEMANGYQAAGLWDADNTIADMVEKVGPPPFKH